MKDEIRVKHKIDRHERKGLLGTLIRRDKKFRQYSVILVVSLIIFVLSYVFQTYPIAFYFLAASFILLIVSSLELANVISSLSAKFQAPDSTGDISFYTFSTDWSEIRTWKMFLSGLVLIGLSLALDKYSTSGIFSFVNPVLSATGMVIILLGGFVLYLRFLSR